MDDTHRALFVSAIEEMDGDDAVPATEAEATADEDEDGGVDWEAVRADYEGLAGTMTTICVRYGITKAQLERQIREGDWVLRRPMAGVSRSQLIARMFRVLERQVANMERNMKNTGDKEVVLLGSMARTLGKLIEIETSRRPSAGGRKTASKDLTELREKLAKRIEQLNQG